MDLFEAEVLAKELISTYLADYKFAFDSKKNINGSCYYHIKTIFLSRHLTALRTRKAVTNTIYHEIAHALTEGDGHGNLWKAQMRRFGLVPERCSSDKVDRSSISNWRAVCNTCGKVNYMVRAPRRPKACAICGKGKFNEKFLLKFTRI